jgi:hypothetical protein
VRLAKVAVRCLRLGDGGGGGGGVVGRGGEYAGVIIVYTGPSQQQTNN